MDISDLEKLSGISEIDHQKYYIKPMHHNTHTDYEIYSIGSDVKPIVTIHGYEGIASIILNCLNTTAE